MELEGVLSDFGGVGKVVAGSRLNSWSNRLQHEFRDCNPADEFVGSEAISDDGGLVAEAEKAVR